jgi:hypothetical protein
VPHRRSHGNHRGPGELTDGKPYAILFTVRRQYFDAIVMGTKTAEVRRATRRWRTVADRAQERLERGEAVRVVFICGRLKNERGLIATTLHRTPLEALGREPSEQGRADIGSGPVIAFQLGGPW